MLRDFYSSTSSCTNPKKRPFDDTGIKTTDFHLENVVVSTTPNAYSEEYDKPRVFQSLIEHHSHFPVLEKNRSSLERGHGPDSGPGGVLVQSVKNFCVVVVVRKSGRWTMVVLILFLKDVVVTIV